MSNLRYRVLELDSNGNGVACRSEILDDHGQAMEISGFLTEHEPDKAGFEVDSWLED